MAYRFAYALVAILVAKALFGGVSVEIALLVAAAALVVVAAAVKKSNHLLFGCAALVGAGGLNASWAVNSADAAVNMGLTLAYVVAIGWMVWGRKPQAMPG